MEPPVSLFFVLKILLFMIALLWYNESL